MLSIDYAGSPLNRPDWPEAGTLRGLLQALAQWRVDPHWDMTDSPHLEPHPLRAPFRGPALKCGGSRYSATRGGRVYLTGTEPIYPEAPQAVIFCGNFLEYSFGFRLATDEPDLIAALDAALAASVKPATVRFMGREFRVVAKIPDTDDGTRAANRYMTERDGAAGVLLVEGGTIYLADCADKGKPV